MLWYDSKLSISYIYITYQCVQLSQKFSFFAKIHFIFLFRYTNIMLFYLVLDKKFSNRFEININTEKTISAIRDFIKAKKVNTFKNIDANNLNLWKVMIPTRIKNNK